LTKLQKPFTDWRCTYQQIQLLQMLERTVFNQQLTCGAGSPELVLLNAFYAVGLVLLLAQLILLHRLHTCLTASGQLQHQQTYLGQPLLIMFQ
jgi:hypothetical protein